MSRLGVDEGCYKKSQAVLSLSFRCPCTTMDTFEIPGMIDTSLLWWDGLTTWGKISVLSSSSFSIPFCSAVSAACMTFFSLHGATSAAKSSPRRRGHFWAGKSLGDDGARCVWSCRSDARGRTTPPSSLHRRWVDPATRVNLAGISSSSSSACGRRLAISGTAWSSPCPSPCPPDDDDR